MKGKKSMKIATWNIERLKHLRQIDNIQDEIKRINADILILTETDTRVQTGYKHCIETSPIYEDTECTYAVTERRTVIYTNYHPIRTYETYNPAISTCVELETDYGVLLVYGTIIGIYGNRNKNFISDLKCQLADVEQLAASKKPVCIAGDYNLSFSDNYYFTKEGRTLLQNKFSESGICILTKDQKECIDHIAISKSFGGSGLIRTEEWNTDKCLSDHKGIAITMGSSSL